MRYIYAFYLINLLKLRKLDNLPIQHVVRNFKKHFVKMFIILFMQNALSFMRTAVFVEVVLSGGAEIAGPEIGKMQDQKMRDQ